MKYNKSTIILHPFQSVMRKTFILISSVVFLAACKKTIQDENTTVTPNSDLKDSYKQIASVVLTTAKNNDGFRTLAYQECNKQKFGDYYVRLSDLLSLNSTFKFWDDATIKGLNEQQEKISRAGKNAVTIFIPSLEKHPEKAETPNRVQGRPDTYAEPIAVIAEEYSDPTQTCPGYVVETNGVLTFYQTIN